MRCLRMHSFEVYCILYRWQIGKSAFSARPLTIAHTCSDDTLVLWLTGLAQNKRGACKMLLKTLDKTHGVLKIRLRMKARTRKLSIHAHEIKIAKYVTPLWGFTGMCLLS